jgi:hypothetical protein
LQKTLQLPTTAHGTEHTLTGNPGAKKFMGSEVSLGCYAQLSLMGQGKIHPKLSQNNKRDCWRKQKLLKNDVTHRPLQRGKI